MKALRGLWERARPLPQVGAAGMVIVALLAALSGCVQYVPVPAAPGFVPGSPLVQGTPGSLDDQSAVHSDDYGAKRTFCLPPGYHVRVFETGRPNYNNYSASYMSTLDRPHGDPLECP